MSARRVRNAGPPPRARRIVTETTTNPCHTAALTSPHGAHPPPLLHPRAARGTGAHRAGACRHAAGGQGRARAPAYRGLRRLREMQDRHSLRAAAGRSRRAALPRLRTAVALLLVDQALEGRVAGFALAARRSDLLRDGRQLVRDALVAVDAGQACRKGAAVRVGAAAPLLGEVHELKVVAVAALLR